MVVNLNTVVIYHVILTLEKADYVVNYSGMGRIFFQMHEIFRQKTAI
jgi:hypothetical protein